MGSVGIEDSVDRHSGEDCLVSILYLPSNCFKIERMAEIAWIHVWNSSGSLLFMCVLPRENGCVRTAVSVKQLPPNFGIKNSCAPEAPQLPHVGKVR